jgi:ankyrin repeat protein
MNEQLGQYLQGFEDKYPHQLEARYSRVLDKIVELWGTPEIESYFSRLLIADRVDRQGFPPEIAREIFELSRAHEIIMNTASEDDDVWSVERTVAKRDIELRGLKFVKQQLFKSVETGNAEQVLLFLRAGMPVDSRDARDWTPLMVAAFNGSEEIAGLLIKYGADFRAQDMGGYTPLHWAAFNGYEKVIDMLLRRGAEANTRSKYGLTPLLQASARGYGKVVEQLLAAGAEPNIATKDGGTPLHKAVSNGHKEVILQLVKAKASLVMRDRNGESPYSIAQKKGKHPAILKLFNSVQEAKRDSLPPEE